MGPGKLVLHMQSLSYTYDQYLICVGLGPSISSVIHENTSYSGPSYPSSPVHLILYLTLAPKSGLYLRIQVHPVLCLTIAPICTVSKHCTKVPSISQDTSTPRTVSNPCPKRSFSVTSISAGNVQAYQITTTPSSIPQGVVMATTGSAIASPHQLSEEASRKRELRLLKNR